MSLLFLVLLFFQNETVPYKAKAEFSVKVDLQFKLQRNFEGNTSDTKVDLTVPYGEHNRKNEGGKSAYLTLKISLLKVSDQEVKAKMTNALGETLYNKKVKPGSSVVIDVGFLTDLKERPSVSEFNLILFSSVKKPVSRIRILIDKDGNYFVNDEQYGKF